jgi:hypothetical protein
MGGEINVGNFLLYFCANSSVSINSRIKAKFYNHYRSLARLARHINSDCATRLLTPPETVFVSILRMFFDILAIETADSKNPKSKYIH